MSKSRATISIALAAAVFAALAVFALHRGGAGRHPPARKLYWFIPDGLRAEPDVFQIYKWAEEGKLPNLKKMMERGSYGYSIPVFPSHTPVNFAALLTGAKPEHNGVSDGPMHLPGYPLSIVSLNGFSSTARKLPVLPYTLEQRGYKAGVLSVPGTTPPELESGITMRGRWGGWGVDFPAMIFQSRESVAANLENRVFYAGPELTKTVTLGPSRDWKLKTPRSFSQPLETVLTNWGFTLHAFVYDSSDDGRENYDRVLFSSDKEKTYCDLAAGEWSEWLPASLSYELQNDYNVHTPKKAGWERRLSAIPVDTHLKLKVIRLGARGELRVRVYYDNLNEFSVQPSSAYEPIFKALGPMVDFPDSYPAQLVRVPEDKATFLEEAAMSLDWHRRLAGFALNDLGLQAVVHNVYTPNQMLTSRWWLGYLDPKSRRYDRVSPVERERLWGDVLDMYRRVDSILGEILAKADENTLVVLSSDHGVVPLDREVHLNDLFAREGLLKFSRDPHTGIFEIDWARTRAVFLKMDGVYVNPDGLDGNYSPASGPKYEALRARVRTLIENLRDENGVAPLAHISPRERASLELGLEPGRVADLVIANRAGFSWTESLSEDLKIFSEPAVTGYKQAVSAGENHGMWTPFVIVGPGIRAGHALPAPIHHVDQYPTIMKALGEPLPDFAQGHEADVF
jgi:predicted AlkP superfamily phosphohydrolase/phosphomutase